MSWRGFVLAVLCLSPLMAAGAESRCHGTVSNGRLEDGVRLAHKGPNFTPYSSAAVMLGRTQVHSRVARIVEDAYEALAREMPGVVFVYGETGWREGGPFQPHRSHQNGLSVDFFVPVRDRQGRSVSIPTSPLTRFGYDLEFNAAAELDDLSIDFPALAEHLHQLDLAARKHGASIALVIFDPAYDDRLFATPRGPAIRGLRYLKRKPWVRHDEHFHVDFAIPCEASQPPAPR